MWPLRAQALMYSVEDTVTVKNTVDATESAYIQIVFVCVAAAVTITVFSVVTVTSTLYILAWRVKIN